MASKSKSLALPDDVFSLLAAADKQRNFPPGTMQSLLAQETGGQSKYLTDPGAYHYAVNADGKRIAPHTGKISTAFGPLGILESTAADPGYGVKPLANKTLAEQIRFSADYLDARSRSAGSLRAGLAGYGEGAKYSQQVMRRIAPDAAPVVTAVATPAPVVVAQAEPPAVDQPVQATPVVSQLQPEVAVKPTVTDEWQTYLDQVRVAQAPVQPTDLAYGEPQAPAAPTFQTPDFMAALAMLGQNQAPSFRPFGAMRTRLG